MLHQPHHLLPECMSLDKIRIFSTFYSAQISLTLLPSIDLKDYLGHHLPAIA